MKVRKLMLILMLLVVFCTGCREEEKEKGVLQIQNLQNVFLNEDTKTLPSEIKYYETAEEAYNNPESICLEDNEEEGYISFSFTGKNISVFKVLDGILVERNEECAGTNDIPGIGNIQTFSLQVPIVEKNSTIVYGIRFEYNDGYKTNYISFRIAPEKETK